MQPVKKSGVICEDCSLIAHSYCGPHAPMTCTLRSQLLEIAQSNSPNPWEIIAVHQHLTGSSVALDVSASSTDPFPPPTAFKMSHVFKRSQSTLFAEAAPSRPPSSVNSSKEEVPGRRPTLLGRNKDRQGRPTSFSSIDTTHTPNRSSLRSAATAGESLSSRNEPGVSVIEENDFSVTSSRMTANSEGSSGAPLSRIPGDLNSLAGESRRKIKKRESKPANNNCVVQ